MEHEINYGEVCEENFERISPNGSVCKKLRCQNLLKKECVPSRNVQSSFSLFGRHNLNVLFVTCLCGTVLAPQEVVGSNTIFYYKICRISTEFH